MKIIKRGRREGKTTEIIKVAAKNFSYIVCLSQEEASRVAQEARNMGLDIPFPLTFDEL